MFLNIKYVLIFLYSVLVYKCQREARQNGCPLHGAKTSLDHRIQALLECIGTQITRIRNNENTELCDIVKLFYCKKCSNNGGDICLCSPPSGSRPQGAPLWGRGLREGRASTRISCDYTTHTLLFPPCGGGEKMMIAFIAENRTRLVVSYF